MRLAIRTIVVLALGVCATFLSAVGNGENLAAPAQPVPSVFFGMHFHRLGAGTATPTIPLGAVRLWDAHVMWNDLEPQRGTWKFEHLDDLVNRAQAMHVEVLLTLGLTAHWASSRPSEKDGYGIGGAAAPPVDIKDWDEYVSAVVHRYSGRVHDFEVWNEPNLTQFYTGTPNQLVQLTATAHQIIKAADRSNQVVCPAPTGNAGVKSLDAFLTAGGGNYCDAIGFHLYVNSPEEMPDLVRQIRQVMASHGFPTKPIWNTETGWDNEIDQASPVPVHPFTRVLSNSETAAFVARSYILSWAAGASRFYWYSWDHYSMGLVEPDGKTMKPAGKAYIETEKWMVGATFQTCSTDHQGMWTCELTRPNGYVGWILWHPSRSLTVQIPSTWQAKQVRTLDGNTSKLSSKSLTVGQVPILVQNQ